MLVARARSVRAALRQTLLVMLITVPAVSFGLSLGWVSLVSGEGEDDAGVDAVLSAATTFLSSAMGVPLAARAVLAGRRRAAVATSAVFVASWALTLAGGRACVLAARAAAGVAGVAAWTVVPLMAKEMLSEGVCGAGVAALVPAHNLGVLLMYVASDVRAPRAAVLAACLALAAAHCLALACVPESPAFLAATNRHKEALTALAWLRARREDDPALGVELAALPPPDPAPPSCWGPVRDLLSSCCRRRAFVMCCVVVVGQEACGVLALLQYAERVFVLARGPGGGGADDTAPSRHAVWLGGAQLAASLVALYLVERVGRRGLLVSCAWGTGACLGGAALLVLHARGYVWSAWALAAAVAADSLGVQAAAYAVLADCFTYQHRGCALALVSLAASIGNAVEVVVFPVLAAHGGLAAALALSAALTLLYAAYVTRVVPETRARSPADIYRVLCPAHAASVETACTAL